MLLRGVVVKVRSQPALDFGYAHAFARGIVGDLAAAESLTQHAIASDRIRRAARSLARCR